MSSVNEKPGRANIRIEIKNDISECEAMDIDTTAEMCAIDAEIEDGEISDCKENDDADQLTKNRTILHNKNEIQNVNDKQMAEDEDFLDADEQVKRDTRAKRFGLQVEMLSEQQIQDIHESLGITDEEKINTRFDALHVYGTQEMSTQDVFAYFGKYTPNSVEWINDESCNVVWLDKTSAGRALNHLSKAIAGMPIRGACDPFQNDFEAPKDTIQKNNGTSILLLDDTSKRDNNNIVNVSDLNIPIPPGYWRLGEPCAKAKYILLRYAKRTDKKPLRAEKFSEYYKKYGNPNYGGIRGIISESKKARMKLGDTTKGNPWGRLAKDWHNDVLERPLEQIPSVPYKPKASKSLLNRLGTTKKRSFSSNNKNANNDDDDDDDGNEKDNEEKKSKIPRMRMYADEEEARVIKMKELKKIRALEKIEENILENDVPDLRNRIKNQKVTKETRRPLITSRLQMRAPIKQEIKVIARNCFEKEASESESSGDELNVQQRSKVTVIVKKQSKPSVASTIWSRLADDKTKKIKGKNKNVDQSDSNSSSTTSSSSSNNSINNSDDDDDDESDNELVKNDFSKTLNPRPGFRKDLKSRLGLNNSEHKSPLRIEINNDHYNK